MSNPYVDALISQWQGPVSPGMRPALERMCAMYDLALSGARRTPQAEANARNLIEQHTDLLLKFFRGVQSINTACLTDRDVKVLQIALAHYFISLFEPSEEIRIDAAVWAVSDLPVPLDDDELRPIAKQIVALRQHLSSLPDRYLGKPYEHRSAVEDIVALQMLAHDWLYFERQETNPDSIAAQVHDAYAKFLRLVPTSDDGPLPPTEESMTTRPAKRHLEALSRFLRSLTPPILPNLRTAAPAVVMQECGKPVLVNGKRKTVTQPQWDVLNALANARPKGLTLDSLVTKSEHTDARGILTRLKSDTDLADHIHTAGTPGGRYRLD
jgi:hypothetical protein